MDRNTAVLCAIAKNEEPYIHEWIIYHLKLGFDHIYLYDNSDANTLKDLQLLYPKTVTVLHYPGKCLQLPAYNDFILRYGKDHTWCAYIDIDEFFVLKKEKTIKEVLQEKCRSGALAVNWVLFGSNHVETFEDLPVIQRFTKRQMGTNVHIKWVVCLQDLEYMITPHHGKLKRGIVQDYDGNIVDGPYHDKGNDNAIQLNHYFTKSKEEFLAKCKRGRADIPEIRDFESSFALHNRNEIEDTSAWDFFRSTPIDIASL